MTKRDKIAWAAGFFDGEGCVNLVWHRRSRNTNSWWKLQIVLTNTSRESLERFVDAVGEGRIYARKPVEGRKQVYYVLAADRVAERILSTLLPFLFTKKQVAELGLESRGLGQRKPFEIIPKSKWERLIQIENAIKGLNGANYRKVMATPESRHYQYIEV